MSDVSSPQSDPQGWLRQAESWNDRGPEDIAQAIEERLDTEIAMCERNVESLSRELMKILMDQQREQAIRAELAWNERKRDALRAAKAAAVAEVLG